MVRAGTYEAMAHDKEAEAEKATVAPDGKMQRRKIYSSSRKARGGTIEPNITARDDAVAALQVRWVRASNKRRCARASSRARPLSPTPPQFTALTHHSLHRPASLPLPTATIRRPSRCRRSNALGKSRST